MEIAFHAPMKAPDHPVPSGDRRMAQLLLRALRLAGHRVSIASRMRSYNATGDATLQHRIRATASRSAGKYIARHRGNPPDLWFTYHCYHKAPDLLGPTVADAFGIPYVIADASIAPKQMHGPWADGYAGAFAAIHRADRLIAFDPTDVPALRAWRPAHDVVSLPPLAVPMSFGQKDKAALRRDLAQAHGIDPARPWLASVAMMRDGAKLASYKVLSNALTRIAHRPWALLVAGGGLARPQVEATLGGLDHVHFLGRLDSAAVDRLHNACDLALWPGIDEGYCMALVEAQVAGLPAIAGKRPGIASVVENGKTGLLTPVGDDIAFAQAVEFLLGDEDRRAEMSRAAAATATRFGLENAATQLDAILQAACARREAA